MALHFPERQQSRFSFRSFSARFVCIADELNSPSLFSLLVFVQSHMVRSSHLEVFYKKVVLEILQNSQENTCPGVSFLLKFAGQRCVTLLKMGLWHRCFPMNFVKFLRTSFLQNTSRRLLLYGFVCQN